jgi:Big-like domain-containing protein/VCBS repeat protein
MKTTPGLRRLISNLIRTSALKGILTILLASLLVAPVAKVSALTLNPTVTTLTVSSAGSPVTTVASPGVVTLTAATTAGGSPVTVGVVDFCYSAQLVCNGASQVGTAQLTAAGTATISFRPAVGSHSYIAVFMGNASDQTSTSTASVLTVTQGTGPVLPTSTAITLSGSPGDYTLSGTVTGDGVVAPTGALNFIDLTNGNNTVASPTLSTPYQGPGFLMVPASTDFQNAAPLATGDLNGDGIPDLITALSDGTVVSQLGNGDGSFTTVATISSGGSLAAVGDFNSDGKLDVAVSSGGTVSIFLGDGTGKFNAAPSGSPIAVSPQNMLVADFNKDGILDLALADSQSAYVFLGAGDGTFTADYSTAIPGLYGNFGVISNIVVGDFNADGTEDIGAGWLSIGFGGEDTEYFVTFLFGDGTGGFTPSQQFLPADFGTGTFNTDPLNGAEPEGMVLVANDVNGDGRLDVSVLLSYIGCCPGAQVTGDIDVLNNGDGTFSQAINFYGFYLGGPVAGSFVDMTGNGSGTEIVRWNAGSVGPVEGGTPLPAEIFFDGVLTLSGTLGGGFVTGDFNGDGIPDLALGGPVATSIVGIQTINSATATHVAASPAGTGVHQVEGSYGGDAAHSASISNTVSLATLQATPTITLSSLASIAYGTPATITATLVSSGVTPTGSITFLNGTTTLGTGVLAGGVAMLTLNNLNPGSYTVTATYPGDTNNLAATAAAITITVTTQLPGLTLATPTASTTYGSGITLTATMTVNGTLPSGSISFKNGSSVLGSQALDKSGVATLVLPAPGLPAGTDSVTATFAGNTDYSAVTSAPLTVTVNKATSAIVLTSSATSIPLGTAETFVLTLPAADTAGTGTVTFYLGSVSFGSSTVSSGSAKLTTTALPAGMDSITASYSGDVDFSSATSPAIVVMVAPTLTITSAVPTIYSGVSDAIQVTLGVGSSIVIPTGTITLSSGSYTSTAAALSVGSATITIPANTLPAGSDTVVANYSGDANFPVSSGTIVLTVSTAPPPGFTISAPSLTVAPGATTGDTVQVTLTPVTGFTGSVNLTAKVTSSPQNATAPPTVSFGSNSSVTLTGTTAVTATLTISTTGSTTAHNETKAAHGHPKWLASGGTVLAWVFLWGIPGRRRKGPLGSARNLTLLLVFFAAFVGALSGCGGGSPVKMANPGTTPGTYSITVTGTSGAISSTGTVMVTVQ